MSRDYAFPKAVDWNDLSDKRKAQIDLTSPAWGVFPKLDGCAMVIRQIDGKITAETASGKPVLSMDHILKVFERLNISGDYVVCGEVWHPDMSFQDISGAFRRHSTQYKLQFWVWDVRHCSSTSGWQTRMHLLAMELLHKPPGVVLCRIPRTFKSIEDVQAHALELRAFGNYDGAILRDLTAPWFTGRSKGEVIKIKPLVSMDLEVVGVDAAFGEKTGRVTASLVCRISKSSGLTQKVSTGMTHAQQLDAAANPHNWIGKIVEVEGMGYTADGLIREPRFKGVREDKLEADR